MKKNSNHNLRLAFVTTWYGDKIGGGAEAECRTLVHALKDRGDIEVEVLTTTLKEFASDWNDNFHPSGTRMEQGVKVHRFRVKPFDRTRFGPMNEFRLMPPVTADLWESGRRISPLTPKEEEFYLLNMVQSPPLYRFLERHRNHYDFFIMIPYMFAPVVTGIGILKKKAILIPCLHDERYAYMNIYQKMMDHVGGLFFHVPAEQRLAHRLYGITNKSQSVIGEIIEIPDQDPDGAAFREKYGIQGPFLLYAGRKIKGKNLPLLVEFFKKFRRTYNHDLKLILIGNGDLNYTGQESEGIIDLGFVSQQEKMAAFKEAHIFCMPSLNESFSIVIMEAWLQGTPVLVHAGCEVTKEHCELSGGGFAFQNYEDFAQQTTTLLTDQMMGQAMGQKGRAYVKANFQKSIVVEKLVTSLLRWKKDGIDP